jgi:uncharacterized protein YaeQ
MALTATVYNFDIQLSDVDRGVYESLSFKAAQHPSESDEYLVARVLAYCLEYREGIAFSKGLAEPDEPAVVVRDLTGALQVWVEIGTPDAERLHRPARRRRAWWSTPTRTRRGGRSSSRARASIVASASRSWRWTGR